MEIGKLPNSVLNKLIIEKIKKSPSVDGVLTGPSIGEDCALLDFEEELILVSTDPITASQKNAGKLLINVCANDIAAAGGTPVGITVTALFPPTATEKDITTVADDLIREAKKRNIALIGGHTEITDAVNRIVLSGTILGKVEKGGQIHTGGAMPGDKILMTKYAGLEGSVILTNEFEGDLRVRFGDLFVEKVMSWAEETSVVKEAAIAKSCASSMHDITEGGVLGACAEAAEASGLGFRIDLRNVNIKSETGELCKFFRISPFELISSGSLLITAKDGEALAAELERNGVQCCVIGEVTDGESALTDLEGETKPLIAPAADAIYAAIRRRRPKEKTVVFVCAGNTCRSPMAEGFAKKMSKSDTKFVSRGIYGAGGRISENSFKVMWSHGVDMSNFESTPFKIEDAESAFLILTMENSHKRKLLKQYHEVYGLEEKLFTLREYAYGKNGDIYDPLGLGFDEYEKCARVIMHCVSEVLKKI